MRIKYLEERLDRAFGRDLGEEMKLENYKECLDMLFEMALAFDRACHEKFKEFYYNEYKLPSEKIKE